MMKEIDEYLSGELSSERMAAFEKRMQEEPDFKNEVKLIMKVIEGIEGYAFKQQLKYFHQKFFPLDKDS